MNTEEDALVQVLVPRQHLTAVYALIAERDGALRSDGGTDDGTDGATDGGTSESSGPLVRGGDDATDVVAVPWSRADLQRFARTPHAMNVTLCTVLDVLADDPEQYFATSDLEELTGITRSSLRGAFSALTRHLRVHYGGRGWMLSRAWGPALDPRNPAEACYRLTVEQAVRWREAREQPDMP